MTYTVVSRKVRKQNAVKFLVRDAQTGHVAYTRSTEAEAQVLCDMVNNLS